MDEDNRSDDGGRPTGPWRPRVRFAAGGGFAYRPDEVLVHGEAAELAEAVLRAFVDEKETDPDAPPIEVYRDPQPVARDFVRFRGHFDPGDVIRHLHSKGVLAQVNHVMFAIPCCPPHPSRSREYGHEGPPFPGTGGGGCGCGCGCGCGGGHGANPFYGTPFYGTPFYGTPFYGTPFYGTPFYGTPFYGTPFYGTPFYGTADPSPFVTPWAQTTGARRSSARPAPAPEGEPPRRPGGVPVRVAILDTGWAESHRPQGLGGINVIPTGGDRPDEDGDRYLDPAAGHGTFIAGIIEQRAPGCELEVIEVLSTQGDGDEADVATTLVGLAQRDEGPPHLVNLSFGGYAPLGMGVLAHAVFLLQEAGTVVVAAAGNDSTCVPMLPAALPGVVSVGALDSEGKAASFTNYGPWVRACTLGVDVVSIFFEGFDGAEPHVGGVDPDHFEGWATWSGTSFAAPRVVAALARAIAGGSQPAAAVVDLIDDPALPRVPMLGTIVDQPA